jgi:hypothetical protein
VQLRQTVVLAVGRRSSGHAQPKLRELIRKDMFDFGGAGADLQGYDACFLYVSGAGTGGKAMWAQVKKRTEDALLALFPSAYMVRLGALRKRSVDVSISQTFVRHEDRARAEVM